MKKVRVELLEEYTDNIKEYEVVTREEALKAIDNFKIAEALVDDTVYELGCTIEIDLETGEVYSRFEDGTFSLEDTTTVRFICEIKAYYDFYSLSEIVVGHEEFEAFEKQYQDWNDEIEREYSYEFNDESYSDVYEAYVVEVLGENIKEYYRRELIDTMDQNIDSDIYEDTKKFYDEAKVIMEI
jgi:hypothetical protein